MFFLPKSRNFFCASFSIDQKKFYFLWREHALKKSIFLSKSRLKTLVFRFFRTSETYFKSDTGQFEELSFAHLLVVSRNKISYCGAVTFFFLRKKIAISQRVQYFKRLYFTFSYFKDLFFRYYSDQL